MPAKKVVKIIQLVRVILFHPNLRVVTFPVLPIAGLGSSIFAIPLMRASCSADRQLPPRKRARPGIGLAVRRSVVEGISSLSAADIVFSSQNSANRSRPRQVENHAAGREPVPASTLTPGDKLISRTKISGKSRFFWTDTA